ncbi:hypothetical protein FACS189490_03190 [Clostridia bacterium]|nr:hypothetical protein FACS189490_03190 [Clostridia bacterium]
MITEKIMNLDAFQAYVVNTFSTRRVRVLETNSVFTVEPIKEENNRSADILRGMFSDTPELSVDSFLERKHADKALDL